MKTSIQQAREEQPPDTLSRTSEKGIRDIIILGVVWAIGYFSLDVSPEMMVHINSVASVLALGIYRVIRGFVRNNFNLFILIPLLSGLVGCNTLGVTNDKLSITREFSDTDEVPVDMGDGEVVITSRETRVFSEIKGGAGDVALQDQLLDWVWDKNGSGRITTTSTQSSDSTRRAESIEKQLEINARHLETLAQQGTKTLGIVGGLVAARMGQSENAEAQDKPTDLELDGIIPIDVLNQAIRQVMTPFFQDFARRLGALEDPVIIEE